MVERLRVTRTTARQRQSRPPTQVTTERVGVTQPSQSRINRQVADARAALEFAKKRLAEKLALERRLQLLLANAKTQNERIRYMKKLRVTRDKRQAFQKRVKLALRDLERVSQGRPTTAQVEKQQRGVIKTAQGTVKVVRRPASKGGSYTIVTKTNKVIPTVITGGGDDLDQFNLITKAQKRAVRSALKSGVPVKRIQNELNAYYKKQAELAKRGEREQYIRIARLFAKDFKKALEESNRPITAAEAAQAVNEILKPLQTFEVAPLVDKAVQAPPPTLQVLEPTLRRNIQSKLAQAKKKKTVVGNAEVAMWSFLGNLVQAGQDIKDTPKALNELRKDPSLLLKIPSAIKDSLQYRVQLLKTSPSQAVGLIGSDILILKGSSSALRALGSVGTKLRIVIDPRIARILQSTKKIPITVGKKTYTLEVVSKIPKQKLIKQIQLAGKRVNAISSQADALVTALRGSKVIRKPLGDLSKLSQRGKELLAKFDKGLTTASENILLDKSLQRAGVKGLLERSFFADPSGKIRPSRLGVGKSRTASLVDLLTGNVTLRTARPQILFFPNAFVQQFPESLSKVVSKIKKGVPLTLAEERQLLKFQLKRSGKFKPLGFLSQEAELTLAPNEIIKRVKVVKRISIKGKVIDIVQAKVVKAPKDIDVLIKKLRSGKITTKELRALNQKLIKKTGFDYSLTSSSRKVLNLRRLSLASAASLAKYSAKAKKVSRVSRTGRSKKKTTTSKVSRKKPSRTVKKTSLRRTSTLKRKSPIKPLSVRKPSKTSRPTSTSRTSRKKSPTKSPRRVPPRIKPPAKPPVLPKPPIKAKWKGGYAAYVRVNATKNKKARWLRVNKQPVTQSRASKLGKYVVENSVSAAYVIQKVTGNVIKGKITIPRVLSSNFRTPKRRSKLSPKVQVEKRKYRINTRGEKRGLRAAQLIQRVRKKGIPKKKRVTKKKVIRRKKRSKK